MLCHSAEEMILDAFCTSLTEDEQQALYQHLSGCEECRHFQETQQVLDQRLEEHFAGLAPGLNSSPARMPQIRKERWLPAWDILPDILHIGSGLLLTAGCIWLLPLPPHPVWRIGLGATLVSYLLQTLFRAYLEDMEQL
jgi:hypothetical protein